MSADLIPDPAVQDWRSIPVMPGGRLTAASTAWDIYARERASLTERIEHMEHHIAWSRTHRRTLAGVRWFWWNATQEVGEIYVSNEWLLGSKSTARDVARHIGGEWRRMEREYEPGQYDWVSDLDGVTLRIHSAERDPVQMPPPPRALENGAMIDLSEGGSHE